jgi:hypothetical protein
MPNDLTSAVGRYFQMTLPLKSVPLGAGEYERVAPFNLNSGLVSLFVAVAWAPTP